MTGASTGHAVHPVVLIVNNDPQTVEAYERMLGDDMCVTGTDEPGAYEFALELIPDVIVADTDTAAGSEGRLLLNRLQTDVELTGIPVVLVAAAEPEADLAPRPEAVMVRPVAPALLQATVRAEIGRARALRRRSSTLRESVAAVLARARRAMERG